MIFRRGENVNFGRLTAPDSSRTLAVSPRSTRWPMPFVLQPWQFFVVILVGWVHREQQKIIVSRRSENKAPRASPRPSRESGGLVPLLQTGLASRFVCDQEVRRSLASKCRRRYNDPMNKKPEKPNRTWFQFSLGNILLLLAVIAMAMGWWCDHRNLTRRLEEARSRIQFLETSQYFDSPM